MEIKGELKEYIENKKRINIFTIGKLRKLVEIFVENEVRSLGICKEEWNVKCLVRNFHGYDIDTFGRIINTERDTIILINERLVDAIRILPSEIKLPNSIEEAYRINLFLTIYHEIEHLYQAYTLKNGIIINEKLYKDEIIQDYFKKRYESYYGVNYNVFTSEVLANLSAVNKTLEFFRINNIKLTDVELGILKLKRDINKKYLEDNTRINPVDKKRYNIDELYQMILENKIEEKQSLLSKLFQSKKKNKL